MNRKSSYLVLVLLAAGLASACGQQQEQGRDAGPAVASTLTVTSVTPERESVLRVGQEVQVRLEVQYTLGSVGGNLGLVVQTGDGQVLEQQVLQATRGEHALTLEASFTVPETDMVHLVVPLSERGRNTTSDVEIISYEVDPR